VHFSSLFVTTTFRRSTRTKIAIVCIGEVRKAVSKVLKFLDIGMFLLVITFQVRSRAALGVFFELCFLWKVLRRLQPRRAIFGHMPTSPKS
jgi:hypothetical protein